MMSVAEWVRVSPQIINQCTISQVFCWLIRVSLFIELGGPQDLGTGWWGALGTFMISRPI